MNKDYLELANKAEPALMQKTAMAIKLTEKMAPEFVGDVLEDFETICGVTQEKLASVPDPVKARALDAVGVGATMVGGIAASLGTALASDLYDAARRGLTKARNYKRIMEFDPSLKEVPASGNKNIKNTFNMLHRFAPDFTADPVLGSSLLRSLVSVPVGNEMNVIKDLIGSRKNILDTRRNQYQLDVKDLRGAWRKGKGQESHTESGDHKTPGVTPTNEHSK